MSIFTPIPAFDNQTPADDLDNQFVFNNIPLGDSVASAVVTVSPSGLMITDQLIVGNAVTAWVTGGTAGVTYVLTCTVTTTEQRVYARSGTLTVNAVV